MKENKLLEIKNNVAKKYGWKSWNDCIIDSSAININNYVDEIAIDYHQSELKLSKSDVISSSLTCKKCNGYFGININHQCCLCLEKMF